MLSSQCTCLGYVQGHIKQLITLSFSPNGYTLATGKLFRFGAGVRIHKCVLWAAGSDDNTSNIWDLRQRKIVYTLLAHSALVSQVQCVAFWCPNVLATMTSLMPV